MGASPWMWLLWLLLVLCTHGLLRQPRTSIVTRLGATVSSAYSSVVLHMAPVDNYLDGLKNPAARQESIESLLELPVVMVSHLSPADTKTIMYALIIQRDVQGGLIKRLVKLFEEAGVLTSELVYVGVRTAVRRMAITEAYHLMKEISKRSGLVIDVESVDAVVSLLCRNNFMPQAWEILKRFQRRSTRAWHPEEASYTTVIENAGRLGLSKLMIEALATLSVGKITCSLRSSLDEIDTDGFFKNADFDSVIDVARRTRRLPQEDIFLTSLQHCAYNGDYASAESVFVMYEKVYGVLQTQTYSLLLVAYVSSLLQNATADQVFLPGSDRTEKLTDVMNFLISSNLDSSPAICNLLLQSYCLEKNITDAASYLARIIKTRQIPGVASMLALTKLIVSIQNATLAKDLLNLQRQHAYFPSPALLQLAQTVGNVTIGQLAEATSPSSAPVAAPLPVGIFAQQIFGPLTSSPSQTASGKSENAESSKARSVRDRVASVHKEYNPTGRSPFMDSSDKNLPCGCGSGLSYRACCELHHMTLGNPANLAAAGAATFAKFTKAALARASAPNPIDLIRARYTAVKYSIPEYLIATSHPFSAEYKKYLVESKSSTKSSIAKWRKDLQAFSGECRKLEVLGVEFGHRNGSEFVPVLVDLGTNMTLTDECSQDFDVCKVHTRMHIGDPSAMDGLVILEEKVVLHRFAESDYLKEKAGAPSSDRAAAPAKGFGKPAPKGFGAFPLVELQSKGVKESRWYHMNASVQVLPGELLKVQKDEEDKKSVQVVQDYVKLSKDNLIKSVKLASGVGNLVKGVKMATGLWKAPLIVDKSLSERQEEMKDVGAEVMEGGREDCREVKNGGEMEGGKVVVPGEKGSTGDVDRLDESRAPDMRSVTPKFFLAMVKAKLQNRSFGEVMELLDALGNSQDVLTFDDSPQRLDETDEEYCNRWNLYQMEDCMELIFARVPFHMLKSNFVIMPSDGYLLGFKIGNQLLDLQNMPALAIQIYPKIIEFLFENNETERMQIFVRELHKQRVPLPPLQVHVFMEQQYKRNETPTSVIGTFDVFFPNLVDECPHARAVGVLVRALMRLRVVEPAERDAEYRELGLAYVKKLVPHIPELRKHQRSPSAIYGTISRMVRLATDGGDLPLAINLFLLMPPSDRRAIPWIYMSLQCAEIDRVQDGLKLLPCPVAAGEMPAAAATDISNLPPEVVGYAIQSLSMGGHWQRALLYEPVLYASSIASGRTAPWALSYLLYAAAQGGQGKVASNALHEMTRWNYTASELDYNFALMSYLRSNFLSRNALDEDSDRSDTTPGGKASKQVSNFPGTITRVETETDRWTEPVVDARERKCISEAGSVGGFVSLLQQMQYDGLVYSMHNVVIEACQGALRLLEEQQSTGRSGGGSGRGGGPDPQQNMSSTMRQTVASLAAPSPSLEFSIPLSPRMAAHRRTMDKIAFLLGSLVPVTQLGDVSTLPSAETPTYNYVTTQAMPDRAESQGEIGKKCNPSLESSALTDADLLNRLNVPISEAMAASLEIFDFALEKMRREILTASSKFNAVENAQEGEDGAAGGVVAKPSEAARTSSHHLVGWQWVWGGWHSELNDLFSAETASRRASNRRANLIRNVQRQEREGVLHFKASTASRSRKNASLPVE